nr:class I SAM-dependent methyltransferase [uncultured Desulfobacter sp.]
MSVLEAEFWENQWQKAVDESPARKRALNFDIEKMDRWNEMAKDFAGRVTGEKATARRMKTLADLCERGILTKDSTVLDIGAGPGAWALPLAEHCKHVTALEPADAMAEILISRASENGITNITVHRSTWQAVDLDALNWNNNFDLVFASMTPGVDGPAPFKKMLAACRGHCYLSTFAGPGCQSQYSPLWEIFFDEPLGHTIYDIIYPFNLVYTMGYRPILSLLNWEGENAMDREEALRMFNSFFEDYMEITRDAKADIAEYIDQHTKDGKFVRPGAIRIGTMIWPVD